MAAAARHPLQLQLEAAAKEFEKFEQGPPALPPVPPLFSPFTNVFPIEIILLNFGFGSPFGARFPPRSRPALPLPLAPLCSLRLNSPTVIRILEFSHMVLS